MAKWSSTLLGCLCILWASITITGCSGSDNNSPQPSSSNSQPSESPTSPGFGPGGPGTSPGTTSTTPTMSPGGTLNGVTPTTPTISPGGTLNGVTPTTPTMSPGGTLNGQTSTTPTISPGGTLNGVTPTTPGVFAGISPVIMASNQRSTGVVRQILLAEDSTRDIYVRGDFMSFQGSTANELIRLHADGSVANRFGQGFDGHLYRIALAKTGGGGLYVSGAFAHFDGQPVPHLVRLTRTGALDPAFRFAADFDPGGIAVAEDDSGDVYSVHSGPNLDCGQEPSPNLQCAYALQIARLNADGSLDPA